MVLKILLSSISIIRYISTFNIRGLGNTACLNIKIHLILNKEKQVYIGL